MADLKKLEAAFEVATRQYVAGKIKFIDLQKALRKLEEAGRKAYGINLDFREIDHLIEARTEHFAKILSVSQVDDMTKATWKQIKKEAGIKNSGFLKKADANVGSHLEKYGKAFGAWKVTVHKQTGGDHQLLLKAHSAATALQKSLRDFLNAKEFKSDLAKDLQTKCQKFDQALDDEIARMVECSKKAHDPSAALKAINDLGFAQFKI